MKAILFLFILALPGWNSAYADSFSDSVDAFRARSESRPISSPKHSARILHHGFKTEKSILLIHGLYESPFLIQTIAQRFFNQGFNVVVPLLPGHFAVPLEALDDAGYQQWVDEVEYAGEVTKQLGNKAVIGGYSLGGLLAVDYAIRHPEINSLVLWAPALKLSSKVWFGSYIGWAVKYLKRLDGNWLAGKPPKDGVNVPYFSVQVGVQVAQLSNAMMNEFARREQSSLLGMDLRGAAYSSLKVPVFLVQAGQEDIVSNDEMNLFYESLSSPKEILRLEQENHAALSKGDAEATLGYIQANRSLDYSLSAIMRFLGRY